MSEPDGQRRPDHCGLAGIGPSRDPGRQGFRYVDVAERHLARDETDADPDAGGKAQTGIRAVKGLAEIEEAIKRILNKTYGVCEITGKAIREERLEAVPFTRFSLEGQKAFEQNKRRPFSRGGPFLDVNLEEGVQLSGDD